MAARTRTKDQHRYDRARIAELALKHYTAQEISDIMLEERGYRISRRMVSHDIGLIRKEWEKQRVGSYDALVNESLARLDVLEKEAWLLLKKDRGQRPTRTKVITTKRKPRYSKGEFDDGNGAELPVVEVQESVENDDTEFGPILQRLLDIQAERNRLLGLYPSRKVDVNQQIVVKGYSIVANPENWPGEIVEGEYAESEQRPRLPERAGPDTDQSGFSEPEYQDD